MRVANGDGSRNVPASMLQLFAFAGSCRGTLIGVLLALSAAGTCLAQTPNLHVARQGPWSVDCTAEPQTGEKWCQVGVAIESSQPPFSLQFNYVRDSHMFFARGSFWLNNVHVTVDDQPEFQLSRCLSGMCLLKDDGASRLLGRMRAGHKVTLRFEGQSRVPLTISYDLADFEPMYRRLLAAPR
jgi:invasion protein IalB